MTTAGSDKFTKPAPVVLPANQPRQFYQGGQRIAELRGEAHQQYHPEDWVASATTRFGQAEAGLSRLPDGRLLRDAIVADPEWWLGSEHVSVFGHSPALLVKLLDAGQRLPVHCHPSDQFAQQHLGSAFGKTEAWLVVSVTGLDPSVYLGFREDVRAETVERWVAAQDHSALVGALNKLAVQPGDTVHVPAGTPHAIGAGVFIVELQQPTDFSITLEWQGFLADADTAFLGMNRDTALQALNRHCLSASGLASLIKHTAASDGPRVPLLASAASDFFQAERLRPQPALELAPSFGVLIVLEGLGTLQSDNQALPVNKGNTVVIPRGAGPVRLEGDLVAIHCQPPHRWKH